MSKLWLTVSLASVILQAVLIGYLPYWFNGFILTTPDAGGWSCGAQALADTGDFTADRTAGLGYNFNICWSEDTSPAVQQILAGAAIVTGMKAYQLVPLVLIALLALTAVSMWGIGYRLTGSLLVATAAGSATSITPIVLRAHMLTPQNLFGYCLASVLLLVLLHIVYSKRLWWWVLVVPLALLLGYVHTLSFGVVAVSCAVWFIVWYLPSWPWRLGVGCAIVLAAVGIVWLDILPITPQVALELFTSGTFTGYDHPLYDHPAFLGYGLTALAGIGLLFGKLSERRAYWLVVCWLIVPLLLGHLSWFGLILMPDRFVAYIWFSAVLFAAIGLVRLRDLLGSRSLAFAMLVVLMWGAQLTHAVVYIKDDVAGWSDRFKPHAEFITALQWLNTQADRGTVVGITAVANREITFAPIWYDGPVASYPWYNLNHRKLKSFKANSALYQQIFANPTDPEYLRVEAFYTMIAKPKSDQAYQAATQYKLAYLIIPKESQADAIWQEAQPAHFPQIYENEKYRIFRLR